MDEKFNIKLADFGYSRLFSDEYGDEILSTPVGTRNYMCPEILENIDYFGEKADIFSLGVILFCMVNGPIPPWREASNDDKYFRMFMNKEKFWKFHNSNH